MRYKVVVETSIHDRPKDHEMSAALILANSYFKSDVTFLRPQANKTPDIRVGTTRWEIKSPIGDGKKTIENNLRAARKQSVNVVLDLRRCKLHQARAMSRMNYFLKGDPHRFKRFIVITKTQEILDIL